MSGRISQLDGLRGLAALTVVVHHSFLVSPVFGEEHSTVLSPSDGWKWWAKYTPLNTFWNGSLAVQIFFVLSGFVLAIPFLNQECSPSWPAYYPRRLVRLSLPVWGSVFFALVLFLAFPRESSSTQSWWVNRHDVPLAFKPIHANLVLIPGTSWHHSPLWSLQYEVIFSLLLPAFLFVAVSLKRIWPAVVTILLLAAHWGASIDNSLLQYLPVFGIGVVLAVRRDLMDRVVRQAPPGLWLALTVVVVGAGSWQSDLFGPFAPTVFIASFSRSHLLRLGPRAEAGRGARRPMAWCPFLQPVPDSRARDRESRPCDGLDQPTCGDSGSAAALFGSQRRLLPSCRGSVASSFTSGRIVGRTTIGEMARANSAQREPVISKQLTLSMCKDKPWKLCRSMTSAGPKFLKLMTFLP